MITAAVKAAEQVRAPGPQGLQVVICVLNVVCYCLALATAAISPHPEQRDSLLRLECH